MIDMEKVGKKIASLRRERGYTGEQLAQRLQVSPQAVSKWENAKCLPETSVLPDLAEALDCSIDSLLYPRELFILEAVYTDGEAHIPVTHFINNLVRDNTLNIYVNPPFTGVCLESDRVKVLTVKYQTPKGIFYTFSTQNEKLVLDKESESHRGDRDFQVIGAYYGNDKGYSSVMGKMEHYDYFRWNSIAVNHEIFPSNIASDDTEYLTLVYLNSQGIHTVSCPEGSEIYYADHRTKLMPRDRSKCILEGVDRLSWGKGMDCPWAGALYAALKYMGETYTYHQIMGMSGACYRVCFTDVWDWSCTDALVAYDYATPLYNSLGYSFRFAERLEKQERKAERQAIMEDIQNGVPVLAINLRVAPEWGVITGYTENGNRLLCRTYFDGEIFSVLEREDAGSTEERQTVYEDNKGYLFSDFWPFIIAHFGEKGETPSPLSILKTSLKVLTESFSAPPRDCYRQGKDAYASWMESLSRESDFQLESDRDNVCRRLDVNDSMLLNLEDARRAAASYLRENLPLLSGESRELLEKIAGNCQTICDRVSAFRDKLNRTSSCALQYNGTVGTGVSTPGLRREQIELLENALALDGESCRLAEKILEMPGIASA